MKYDLIKKIICIILLVVCYSCDDFLDTVPDNRSDLDTEENITNMLVSVYPTTHYNIISELSSDNVDDCGDKYESYSNLFYTEAYKWNDITQPNNDGVDRLWASSYKAIGAANAILESIEKMPNPSALDAQRGEALIARAYNHFVLVNMFSQHYKKDGSDLGITYMTKPEVTPNPKYERQTVQQVYELIDKDIEEALPLIQDNALGDRPVKYHFNRKAAYAFAARFNLFYENYDKVIEYANVVLGTNPKSMMRDWTYLASTSDRDMRGNRFINAKEKANLLLLSITSYGGMCYTNYSLGSRYTYNKELSDSEATDIVGPWGQKTIMPTATWTNIEKATVLKLNLYKEITDPTSGNFLAKTVYPLFTSEEVLLSRAEAYIMSGKYDEATKDIALFTSIYMQKGATATRDQINQYFKNMEYYTPTAPTAKKMLNPAFSIVSDEHENFIHCILLCRRMLLIHEGMRWFDVKRFGIEIYRRNYEPFSATFTETDKLTIDDKRRAIQIPQDAISGGHQPNPR